MRLQTTTILSGATAIFGLVACLPWFIDLVRPQPQRIERDIEIGPLAIKPTMLPTTRPDKLLILDAEHPIAQRLLHRPPKPIHEPFEVFQACEQGSCPEMVLIPAGTFQMGSPRDKDDRKEHEDPQHEVTVDHPFAIAKYETTFEDYDRFAEATGREKPDDHGWGRGKRPVIDVNWHDARAYCSWLGTGYRLPSQAEWEYAARAGTKTSYSFGGKITGQQANVNRSIGKTVEVGRYPSNPWGLYDLHGNVREWIWEAVYPTPDGFLEGSARQARGGAWNSNQEAVRLAARHPEIVSIVDRRPDLGIRCVTAAPPDETNLPFGKWKLVSADPPLPRTERQPSLEYYGQGRIDIHDGCNGGLTYVAVEEGNLTFIGGQITLMHCGDQIMAMTEAYSYRLGGVNQARAENGQLILEGDGRLVFVRLE